MNSFKAISGEPSLPPEVCCVRFLLPLYFIAVQETTVMFCVFLGVVRNVLTDRHGRAANRDDANVCEQHLATLP